MTDDPSLNSHHTSHLLSILILLHKVRYLMHKEYKRVGRYFQGGTMKSSLTRSSDEHPSRMKDQLSPQGKKQHKRKRTTSSGRRIILSCNHLRRRRSGFHSYASSSFFIIWLACLIPLARSQDERAILESFYDGTGGSSWERDTNWKSSSPICTWFGITCENGDTNGNQNIVQINLSENNLNGAIPAEFWRLPKLQRLILRGNNIVDANFSGLETETPSPIDTIVMPENQIKSIAGIHHAKGTLISLNLNKNQLNEPLEEVFYELSNLEELYLAFNQISGTMSSQIGKLNHLTELYLFDNNLSGNLPSELGLLNKCEILGLGNNDWSGSLPTEMNQMVNIRDLSAHRVVDSTAAATSDTSSNSAGLTGPLLAFDSMPFLSLLLLDGNSLTGTIPDEFLRHNKNVKSPISISLTDNKLEGSIPNELARFERIFLDITGNRIESISDDFCTIGGWMGGLVEEFGCDAILCPKNTFSPGGRATTQDNCEPCLGEDYLGARECSSAVSKLKTWEILLELYAATSGSRWENRDGWEEAFGDATGSDASDNEAFDSIDFCSGFHGILCQNGEITELALPGNNLFGTVPESLLFLSSLNTLELSGNNLVVPNFSGGGQNPNLRSIILSNTKVQSLDGIGKFSALQSLYLDGTDVGGALPDELFDLTTLELLQLQHGNLQGSIPSKIGKLSALIELNLYDNKLTGDLPAEIGDLVSLTSFDISQNNLQGSIPPSFSNLSGLVSLSAHNSNFGGSLPAFDNLPNLNDLDLGYNSFEGTIPDTFLSGVSSKAESISVSLEFNTLSGDIPIGLKDFDKMVLHLEGNQVSGIPSTLCENQGWMNGEVGNVPSDSRCDAILCASGSWNEFGKATSDSPCIPCPTSSFFGQVFCGNEKSSREKEILDQFFVSTGGRYWSKLHDNWLRPGVPLCSREGVHCAGDESKNEDVLELRLNGFGLRGTIPSEIWELPKLRKLGLTENPVAISFEGIESATALIVLQTSQCQIRSLNGIEKAPNKLAEVHLARNQFDGVIPDEIFSLTSVRKLFLNDNFFSGTLSKSIGTLSALEVLELQNNRFHGPVPAELESLEKLAELNLANQEGAGFEGPLPVFENNPQLIKIDLSSNEFSGWLSPSFLDSADVTQPLSVNLSYNRLSGPIPETWNRFNALNIELAANMVTDISPVLCSKSDWNDGDVGTVDSCDAILCNKGTYLPKGRQTDPNQPCQACSGGINAAPFYGAVKCENPKVREEREVLVDFYEATNGVGWKESTKWLSSSSHCSWFGVTCTRQGYVKEINLPANLLRTSDATETSAASLILTLSDLDTIDLKGNQIVLDFAQTSASSKLKHLSMSETGLVTLAGVSRASGLRSLHLTNNMMNSIPDEVYGLTDLEELYVSFNEITGPISTKLGMLTKLEKFYAFENKLSGQIPTEVGHLEHMTTFIVGHNRLSGEIPSQFSHLPNLQLLSILEQKGRELITGPLPTFENARKLWLFDAANNDLTGPIPSNFMENSLNTDKDVSIYLQNNEISGSIPESLSKFQRLDLNLAGNRISLIPNPLCELGGWMNGNVGTVGNCSAILCPSGTFNQFGHHSPGTPCFDCPRLESVFLGQTRCDDNIRTEYEILDLLFVRTAGEFWVNADGWQTEAPVCSWAGIRCDDGDLQDTTGVTSIVLESNGLSGTLPSEIWRLPSLQTVNFNGNPNLALTFDGLSRAGDTLENLFLSDVKLETIEGISQASSLKTLDISNNGIFEVLPGDIFDLSSTIEHLHIQNNRFYGSLPTSMGKLTKLKELNATHNQFFSTIPSQLGSMLELERIDLSENLVYGKIPQEVSSMRNLQVFACSRLEEPGPKLYSSLPTFHAVPQLTELYLQGNQIQGPIPSNFLVASRALEVADLSYNLISGTVPAALISFKSIDLHLQGNKISGFPGSLCKLEEWMGGKMSEYGCDAFLCPPGSASPSGKTVDQSTKCNNCTSFEEAAPYFGSTSCDGPVNERDILMDLYLATGGEGWIRNDFWGSLASHCDWYGVACIGDSVVELNLRGNNLKGRTKPNLWDLPRLEILALYSNPVQVDFENIAKASSLIDIRLDSTHLQSLRGIGAAKSLIALDVRHSSLRGPFPQEIFQLTNLRTLSMSGNRLSGSLPSSFTDLDNLVSLHLDENDFNGRLPSFESLKMLRVFDISRNDITGEIPRDFLASVRSSEALLLNLAQNVLTGVVPEELERFDNLSLFARDNRILGMPLSLCNKEQWNKGEVRDYGCDAILCKPGTSNRHGRHRPGSPCTECGDARYYGETLCSSSPVRRGGGLFALMTASMFTWVILLT